jgi:hypothetical protein
MCSVQDSGTIELYFYGELPERERSTVEEHLRRCRECTIALDELNVIRAALAARPVVAAPASGNWSAFMQRLDAAVAAEPTGSAVLRFEPRPAVRRPFVGLLATAALLTIVSISVFLASQAGRRAVQTQDALEPVPVSDRTASDAAPIQAGLASASATHLERSKLVVLGLATREPAAGETADWTYERELATSLLNDTRLYRMAAEQRGLTSMAGVMRDLELVLLQASMSQATDETALPQIQRLIRKRGLVQKMDIAATIGLVP